MGAKNPLRFDTVFEMAKTKPAWTGANSIILEKKNRNPYYYMKAVPSSCMVTKDH